MHILLKLFVHSLSQFFSLITGVREDTICKMANAEGEEEGKMDSVHHHAVGSKEKDKWQRNCEWSRERESTSCQEYT